MQKRMLLILCFGLLVFFSVVSTTNAAAITRWALYDFALDSASIQSGISKIVARDQLIPVGIESLQTQMSVLFVSNAAVGATAWKIESYANADLFKAGMNDHLAQGYTPVDVSQERQYLSVLYLKVQSGTDEWFWNVMNNKPEAVRQEIDKRVSQGWIPIGITMLDQRYAVLFVKTDAIRVTHWAIKVLPMERESLIAGINEKIREGYLPWGYLAGQERANIVFLRMKDE